MPPAVKTEMTTDIPDGADFSVITTDAQVAATLKGLKSVATEIRPGQSNQLYWMQAISRGFIKMLPDPE